MTTSGQRRLLIIDDDVVFAETLGRALARQGETVDLAHDPQSACDLAARQQPWAIVLDLKLAEASGLALIGPLRAACPSARILLLTGFASIATAVEAMKRGATHYLPKPASVAEILAALGREDDEALGGGLPPAPPPDAPMSVGRLEWEHIQRVLTAHDGNISEAARALKMHRRTLQRKLAKRPAAA